MDKRKWVIIFSLILLVSLVGCNQSPPVQVIVERIETVQLTATPIPGWKKFEGGGIEIWLPNRYEGGYLEKESVDMVVEDLRDLGPDYEQQAQNIEQNWSAYFMFIFDTEPGDSELLANIIILKEKVRSSLIMDEYLEAVVKNLPAEYQLLESEIDLNGKYQTGKLLFETNIFGDHVTQLGYSILDGTTMWGIVFSADSDKFNESLPDFEQSIQTFVIH